MERRLTWEEYALSIATTASLRSEDQYRKVGACAINYGNMIIGVGYNGLPTGFNVDESFWDNRDWRREYMIHAETNCLSLFKKGEAKLIAVNTLPCSSCATMIAAYGIPKVVYLDDYEKDMKAKKIFEYYKIKLEKISLKIEWTLI